MAPQWCKPIRIDGSGHDLSTESSWIVNLALLTADWGCAACFGSAPAGSSRPDWLGVRMAWLARVKPAALDCRVGRSEAQRPRGGAAHWGIAALVALGDTCSDGMVGWSWECF